MDSKLLANIDLNQGPSLNQLVNLRDAFKCLILALSMFKKVFCVQNSLSDFQKRMKSSIDAQLNPTTFKKKNKVHMYHCVLG